MNTSLAPEATSESVYEKWNHWPIHWSGIWVGLLSAMAATLLFGLIGIALGFHVAGSESRIVDLKKIGLATLVYTIFTSFIAFVIGGWIAGKISGILHSEPAMLHGAIVWVLAVPFIALGATLGAASYFGAWYSGLAGTPPWATSSVNPYSRPEAPEANATPEEQSQYREKLAAYREKVRKWEEDGPKVARNSALAAITVLLLGLMGSVVGGWMASGEPMTFTYHLHRPARRSNIDLVNH